MDLALNNPKRVDMPLNKETKQTIWMCTYASMYVCIFICMQLWMYASRCVCMYVCMPVFMCVSINVCIRVCNILICVCMYVHIYIRTYVCINICMHLWMHLYMYICTYVGKNYQCHHLSPLLPIIHHFWPVFRATFRILT